MCEVGGPRCENSWGKHSKAFSAARRSHSRNLAKSAQAAADGDTAKAQEYADRAALYATKLEDLHAVVKGEFASVESPQTDEADAGASQREAVRKSSATAPKPDLAALAAEADSVGMQKIIDVPLVDFAPPEVRERLLDQGFAQMRAREEALTAYMDTIGEDNDDVDPQERHRTLDALRAIRADIADYRLETARMLPQITPEEAEFTLQEGVSAVGQAESGTREWLQMRQVTLGGSDVGAICKVGEWGGLDYDRCREQKLDLDPQDQEHAGAALAGDLWEPHLLNTASEVLGKEVYVNKTTFSDGRRHANLDGFTLEGADTTGGSSIETVVECKTSSHPKDWENTAPDSYVLQTQHCMDLHGANKGLLIANINDERLVIYRVRSEDRVPAGPNSIKKLGDSFAYSDVREYAEGMVQKWNGDRETDRAGNKKPVKRRTFKLTDEERETWKTALDKGMVFVDLESSHLSRRRGHIIEFAGTDEQGRTLERLYGVPKDHARWNGTGPVEVHGITLDMVRDQPILMHDSAAQQEIRDFIGDRVVVAHNSRFEAQWLQESGIQIVHADTMRAFGAAVEDEGIKDNSMESFTTWAGVEYREAHRAGPDAQMMARAFGKLRPLLEKVVRD
mgnify:CR=1 FL=1